MGDSSEGRARDGSAIGRPAGLRVMPANAARWEELRAVFGLRGAGARCLCQRYKLERGETFEELGPEVLADRLRRQADCGHPGAEATSGLIAFVDEDPVGWCAVEPRTEYAGLLRVAKVPWAGRAEDRDDDSIWAVTCLFVRAGRRRRGISEALAIAAVAHARERGARALEAYPLVDGASAIDQERQVGTVSTFAAAGLREVTRPTPRRMVMRIDYQASRIPDEGPKPCRDPAADG